jgi:hypothetical protein
MTARIHQKRRQRFPNAFFGTPLLPSSLEKPRQKAGFEAMGSFFSVAFILSSLLRS